MSLTRRPIGVFDSGIGGLTVFKALARRMPEEDLVYFGDTAHVPYGSKSKEAVTRYSLEVARFLDAGGIKTFVVACNTASALALDAIRAAISAPVVGVIEPGARAATAKARARVGIIGTEATIASGAYASAIRREAPKVAVISKACPLFVPLVEEGWWDHRVTEQVAAEYLLPLKKQKIEALILGCTHYPVLKRTIGKVMGKTVALIDSAEQTALETERLLVEKGLRRESGKGRREFYCSDAPERFLRSAKRFLGTTVERVSLHPFDA